MSPFVVFVVYWNSKVSGRTSRMELLKVTDVRQRKTGQSWSSDHSHEAARRPCEVCGDSPVPSHRKVPLRNSIYEPMIASASHKVFTAIACSILRYDRELRPEGIHRDRDTNSEKHHLRTPKSGRTAVSLSTLLDLCVDKHGTTTEFFRQSRAEIIAPIDTASLISF